MHLYGPVVKKNRKILSPRLLTQNMFFQDVYQENLMGDLPRATQPGNLTLHFVRDWRSFLPSLSLETHKKRAISSRDGRGKLSASRTHPASAFTRQVCTSFTTITRHPRSPFIRSHPSSSTLRHVHSLIESESVPHKKKLRNILSSKSWAGQNIEN